MYTAVGCLFSHTHYTYFEPIKDNCILKTIEETGDCWPGMYLLLSISGFGKTLASKI
jgi:hypothetical protein